MAKFGVSKIDLGLALRYYKKKEVQELLVHFAKDKEIGTRYNNGFGKRPDVLIYPSDVLELVKRGTTSFHCSEELWSNPLDISKNCSKKDLDELRSGWDLLLDIDCVVLGYSAICADLVIKFLERCGASDVTVKFSGNKGFHIALPFESFPKEVNGIETRLLFPKAAQKIAAYIKDYIEEELAKTILLWEKNDLSKISLRVGIPENKLIHEIKNSNGDIVNVLNVDSFLEIDTVLISSRHLYRMPYSLHEKSGLLSLPIDKKRVLEFQKPMADPDKFMMPIADFMLRDVSGEKSKQLLAQALDYDVKTNEQRLLEELEAKFKKNQQEIVIENALGEEFFPPCIRKILGGLEDGKKRAVFILANFLGKLGWEKENTLMFLLRWNKEKNQEKLRENYIITQLRYYKKGDGLLPPNCDNPAYYTGLQICNPDGLCKRIKNPVNYSIIMWRKYLVQKKIDDERIAKEERKKEREQKKKDKEEKKLKKETEEMAELSKENAESSESVDSPPISEPKDTNSSSN